MELDKSKKILKEMQNNLIRGLLKGAIYADDKAEQKAIAIETILNELEDSVPKKKIEDKLKYKKQKLQQIENGNDNYRKNCLQIEIDVLEQLLEEDK